VLVVDDDLSLRRALSRTLELEGYDVELAEDGLRAVEFFDDESAAPDVVLLDLLMPNLDGLAACRLIRAKSRVPILMLTARSAVDDRVEGLEAGADDYLAKPFDLAELEARVRAITRRGMVGGNTMLRHGALTYDQVGRVARIHGEALELSAREVNLLEILLQCSGRLVSKDQLVSHLCEWGEEVSPNAIEVYVHRLRKKLEPGGVHIVTVRGLGYRLEKTPQV
jgi:two-component system OmpR family response regulator